MAFFGLWGIPMADEVPETAGAATRNLLGAVGFIMLLLGGEMMIGKDDNRFWWGVGLVCAGVPVFFGGVFWKWIRTRIGPAIAARVDLFTTDPRELALVFIFGLIILRTVSTNNSIWAGAAGAALVIFLFNWRYFKRPTDAAPQEAVKVSLDGRTHLDLVHLLDFAVKQTTILWLTDLIMQAPLDIATFPLRIDGDATRAQRAADFVRHVSVNIRGRTFLRDDLINLMASTEGEAERIVEQTPQGQRPAGIDPLLLRRCAIADLQCIRVLEFLQHARREVEERLVAQRSDLLERLASRSQVR